MASFIIKEILPELSHCQFYGDQNSIIKNAISINDALDKDCSQSVSWLKEKNLEKISEKKLKLGLLVVTQKCYDALKENPCNFLVASNPKSVFIKILSMQFNNMPKPAIESSAFIHAGAKIGSDCYIGRNVVIEDTCVIGNNTIIMHNSVIIAGTKIGNHVSIGCNCTIGNYGFGYDVDEEGHNKLLQHLGNVVLHDFVEIHNNCCIDRGALGSTILHEHVKLDNMVHIAHNCIIGRNTLITAQVMLAGTVTIGENTWVSPSVAIKNQITIGNNNLIGIGAVVIKDTSNNETVIGNPAIKIEEHKKWSAVKKELMKTKIE